MRELPKELKEFPARHIADEEDLRVLLNEYFDNVRVTNEHYREALGELENVEDMYNGALDYTEELKDLLKESETTLAEYKKQIEGLQEIIDIQAKELEELRQQNQQEEDKPKLKRLNKKPLKRLK